MKLSKLSGQSQFFQELWSLRPKMAQAAQIVYNDWDVDEGFGICDQVAEALGGVLSSVPGVDVRDGGWDGDDHLYLIASRDGEEYTIDIPPYLYETGGGYNWKKIDGVQFMPDDVEIYRI